MVRGTINGSDFQAALEPDGKGSHWFRLDKTMLKTIGADAGDTVKLAIEPVKEWTEPECAVRFEGRPRGRSTGTHPVDGDHAHGALGLDPLDTLDQTTRNAQAADRGGALEAYSGRPKALLFQPLRMYRDLCIE